MSAAADSVRAWTLQSRAMAAHREACDWWWTMMVARGMYGMPPADAPERLAEAVERAERLSLEWMMAR